MDDDGDTTEFAYDFAGALISRENPDSSIEEFTNFLTIPLIDPLSGLGTNLNPAPLAMSSDVKGVMVDADNESTQYVLNDLGFVIKSIDADGNETLFERDAFGRVTLQIDPDPDGVGPEPSPETHYEYDIWGNLVQMKLPNGGTRTWNYDLDWHVADEMYDERGQMTMRTLDPLTGYVLESRLLFGQPDNLINLETDDIITEFTYTGTPSDPADPPAGLVERETDPLGNVTYYQYNARGDVVSVTYAEGSADEATAYTYYNSDGTVDYELDELSRRTDYSYDDLGRLVSKLLPDPDGGGPLSRPEFEYEYDTRNRVTKEIDPLGRETIYTYDSHSRVTKVELPDHDGDSKLTASTTKYNDLGQVESTKDPLERQTSYEYDKLGRQTKVIMPQVADPTTAVNEIQILDFDSGTAGTFKLHGNSKSEVVNLSDLSNLQDILDSLWGDGNTSVTLTSTEATIRFRGDLSGTNVAEMTVSDISGTLGATPFVSTDKAGVAATLVNPNTQTTYDPLGRLLTSTDALGKVTEYEYTNFGQNLKITLPDPDGVGGQSAPVLYQVFDVSGNLISQTDANGGETTRDYDKLGRLIRVTQPDPDGTGPLRAPVTEYEYDKAGNLRFVFDALGNVTEYQYDDRHRQVKVISPDPDSAGALSALVTQYEFDDAGQLTKVTAPGSRVTEYGYDGLGRLILTTLPDPDGVGGLPRPETSSTYDAAGRKLTDTDPLSNVTSYDYDALDNLVELTQPDPDGGGPLSSPVSLWEYDDAGQLLNATDPLGNTTSYEYDNLGRTVKVTQPDPDAGGPLAAPVIKYEFSLTGNLLKTMDPLKHETVSSYDFLGRRTSTTDALGGVTAFTH